MLTLNGRFVESELGSISRFIKANKQAVKHPRKRYGNILQHLNRVWVLWPLGANETRYKISFSPGLKGKPWL
jgi:hypothetical protein